MVGQNWTEWKPKPRQRRLLEAAQEDGLNRSILAVCDDAGVARSTFYHWMSNEAGFAEAWDKVWRKAIKRYMPSIVAALVSKARKGDVAAARLVADLAGVLKQSVELTGVEGGPIEIEDVKAEIRRKFGQAIESAREAEVSGEPRRLDS